LVAKKNGSGINFPWALVVLLLAVWAVSLAVPRRTVVFHEGPRWIGENMLIGIPILCAFAVRSAWESDRSKPLTGLTWATDIPLVTVTDLAIPVLMAC